MSELAYINFDEFSDPAPLLPLSQDEEPTQGTDKWRQDKCGCISASRVSDILAKGAGETRKTYLYDLATERLIGQPLPEGFKSNAMEQGNELEPKARNMYELYYEEVVQVGFIRHQTIPLFGASPDGLVGEKGGLELKSRNRKAHYELLLGKKPPRDAMLQIYSQMSCCGLEWVDYCSYNETVDDRHKLVVVRVYRDENEIAIIESAAKEFNKEIDQMVERLRKI